MSTTAPAGSDTRLANLESLVHSQQKRLEELETLLRFQQRQIESLATQLSHRPPSQEQAVRRRTPPCSPAAARSAASVAVMPGNVAAAMQRDVPLSESMKMLTGDVLQKLRQVKEESLQPLVSMEMLTGDELQKLRQAQARDPQTRCRRHVPRTR